MSKFRVTLVLFIIISALAILTKIPMQLGLDLQGGMYLTLEAQDTKDIKIDQDSILGAISVIQNRIDSLGLTEPIIRQKGLRQITVELPGIKDPQRAINLIGETALLEFVTAEWAPGSVEQLSPEKIEILAGKDARLGSVTNRDKHGEVVSETPVFLKKTVLTGSDLSNVAPATNQYGSPVVNIEFKPKATKVFRQVTQEHIGKPLAILLDGKVISAPNIRVAIMDGKAIIEGGFSITEMKDLVIKLKAGSLPIPVEIISNKVVGPTLGKDSIEKSKKAFMIGIALICFFMLLTYRIPGIVAGIALMSYVLVTLATFKLLGATLTLPGIAGLILSIGMAVDANIIIFERIKEERKAGMNLISSVNNGFNRAFVTILDANLTTLSAALVLFWLGTGTIKGFAVSLSLGILTSMFSALVVTKLLLLLTSQIAMKNNTFIFKGKNDTV
jgi:preprotein translocase subunit SecD